MSQVRFLERHARRPTAIVVAIDPAATRSVDASLAIQMDSPRPRATTDDVLLRIAHLPAGRYRLHTTVKAPDARLGVTIGPGRPSRFLAELAPAQGPAVSGFDLPLAAEHVIVKGSRQAAGAQGRTWLAATIVGGSAYGSAYLLRSNRCDTCT